MRLLHVQDAQQQLAAGMAAHSKRVCIQTLQSAEPRDAQKLQLNLEGFIGRIPDHDGIVQQVGYVLLLGSSHSAAELARSVSDHDRLPAGQLCVTVDQLQAG